MTPLFSSSQSTSTAKECTVFGRRTFLTAAGAGAAALSLAACSNDAATSSKGKVSYWLWDSNQLPAYQECADKFHEANPDITVEITQLGWDDYWTKLTAGFVAGTGPDAFTDHISKFAQFVDLNVLVPLDEQEAWSNVDTEAFQPGLIDVWKGEDGHQYGCPKDWDTIATFYNADMLADAGIDPSELEDWAWNPQDGGTFEQILARLTIDDNGVRGDEEGFDKDHVAVYGLGIPYSPGGADGQTQWSPFTGSTDPEWYYMNQATWGTEYRYDDPTFQEAIDWFFSLTKKGYAPSQGDFSNTMGVDVQLSSGSVACCFNGSWMFNTYAQMDLNVNVAPLPAGPIGHPMSMYNGLGDSVSAQSGNIEEAAKWVAYLGTEEAQKIVASYGVVFPAITTATEKAKQVYAETGLAVTPFTDRVDNEETFFYPLSYFGADIKALMDPAMENIYANGAAASTLNSINEEINEMFQNSAHSG